MIKTKEEILTSIKAKLGEDTSDEALAIIEDVSDTLDDLTAKTTDTTDWKAKFEENDKAWRTKYSERFFKSPADEKEVPPAPSIEDDVEDKKYSYDDLFTTGDK